MFAAVVVCLIDSSFILAWNLTYVNTFFHFFLKTYKPFMIMSQYITNENVPDMWYPIFL